MRTIALFLFAALAVACTRVDAGHVGVEVNNCSGGGVKPTPLGVGFHWAGACTDIIETPTFQQTLLLQGAEAVTVTSSEGLPIGADVSLSFTVDGAKAPSIFEKYRKDLEHIMASYMRQAVREAMQETFAKYTAQQLYSDKKEVARAEVQGHLVKKLSADGFNVTQYTINETRVPAEVLNAIKAKVAMVQQAQAAEQAVAKATAEGNQKVATAEAEARAIRAKADAEAYANRKVAESISPTLVEYLRVQRWNGEMPQVTGAATPFVTVK